MAVKYKKPRTKRVRPPKPLKPQRPERPKRTVLRNIYKELFTTDRDQRVNALAQSMTWYDKCQAYVAFQQEGTWTKNQLREKNKGESCRLAGIKTNNSISKEEHFISAIHHFEKVVSTYKPPLLTKYLQRLNRTKKKLESRKQKLKDKFGIFMELLEKALRPKNIDGKYIQLRIDRLKHPYRIDSEGNVTLDRKVVLNLRRISRQKGLLTGVLEVMTIFSEAASRMPELDTGGHKTGRMIISYKKRYHAVLEMINHLIHYSLTDEQPRKLVRKSKPKKEKQEPSE